MATTVPVQVRMPPELLAAAKIAAAKQDRSVSWVIRSLLQDWLETGQ